MWSVHEQWGPFGAMDIFGPQSALCTPSQPISMGAMSLTQLAFCDWLTLKIIDLLQNVGPGENKQTNKQWNYSPVPIFFYTTMTENQAKITLLWRPFLLHSNVDYRGTLYLLYSRGCHHASDGSQTGRWTVAAPLGTVLACQLEKAPNE